MRDNPRPSLALLLACLLVTSQGLGQFRVAQFRFAQFKPALPGYRYEFPRDYFSHPDYQTEWWYYTGHLQTADGRTFGFELTFFREGVTRDSSKASTWDVRDFYLAHFAVSDLAQKEFLHIERTNRAGPGIAGADPSLQKIWNGNWSVVWANGGEHLTAITNEFAIRLSLLSVKPPAIHGENGVSQKSADQGHASHYFSETRLQASGTLTINSQKYQVTGLAWMDHEFFTQQLDSNQVGWDWLSLQFDDNTELMLFRIRRKDGSIDPFSSGTFIDARGHTRHLRITEFQLEPDGHYWRSASTEANYPVHWKLRVPSLDIAVEISTPLFSQEFTGSSRLSPDYWEGIVFAKGIDGAEGTQGASKLRTSKLAGSGYLEMTGYARPVNVP